MFPERRSVTNPKRTGRIMLIFLAVVVGLILLIVGYFAFLSSTAQPPTTLGMKPDGTLAPCANKPNCVSTFATDDEHKIRAYDYVGSSDSAWAKLKEVVASLPSARVVTATDNYMHVEFTSRLFQFIDDVEFVLDPGSRKVQFKSASRVGHSDLGVNRGRMEDIRVRFAAKIP